RNPIQQNNRRRKIGSIHLDVFQADDSVDERLQYFDVFYAIQLQGLGNLAENAFGHFQALVGQLKDLVLRFQISPEPDEDRDDEPAKKKAEDEKAQIFQLRRRPATDRYFLHACR